MIIDFHTHTFPPHIAERAMKSLAEKADMRAYTDGTNEGLRRHMAASGVDACVLMPVVTNPAKQATINRLAAETNETAPETGLFSFGGIHPDNENYKEIIRFLASHGVKGIKFHPVFTGVDLDDIRYMRIIDYANEQGLFILTHGGLDISFPGQLQASPLHIRRMLDQVKPDKLILAHMGGWGLWDQAEELLLDYPLWLDLSTCLPAIEHLSPTSHRLHNWKPREEQLSQEQFVRMVRRLGADRVLFASDSPWCDQKATIDAVEASGLNDAEKALIFSGNAKKILKI